MTYVLDHVVLQVLVQLQPQVHIDQTQKQSQVVPDIYQIFNKTHNIVQVNQDFYPGQTCSSHIPQTELHVNEHNEALMTSECCLFIVLLLHVDLAESPHEV